MALSFASAAQDPQPPQLRLGDAATPRAYDVRLAIDPRTTAFEGEVRIEMRINRATPVLWLNAHQLDIHGAEFVVGARRVPARVIAAAADFVGFTLEGGFPEGDAAAFIRYRGSIEQVATRGLFRQKEGDEWYVVSQFESMNARRAMPCFDEPGWKVPWQLTIDAPAADKVLSNTPETSLTDVPGRAGWKRHVFATTRPLPSYLVALAVGPFDVVQGEAAGKRPTPMAFAAPKARAGELAYALAVTGPLLAQLEEYFGMPYPFEKLDSATIPAAFGFGAMENVGLITYSSGLLLSPPERESLGFRRRYASIASHEIAHMWFGNLVTLAWWDDIWLNEAFASWAAYKNLRAWKPEWAGGWRDGEQRRRALLADRLVSARRIANPVATRDDVSASFDRITYDKGAVVLRMFETWLGAERFRAGVRSFLQAHAYGNATSLDFFQALGDASGRGEQAVAAFRSFVQQPGIPLVDVSLRCARGAIAIDVAQQRMTPRGTRGAAGQWTTPACFSYQADGKVHRQCAEITGKQSIALSEARACPAWVVGNAGGAGHWLARYNPGTLKTLAAQAPNLPQAEAMALASDTSLLLTNGLVRRDDALRLAEGLLRHSSIGVRQGAVELLEEQREAWLTAAQRARSEGLRAKWVLPLAREVGWQERAGEDIGAQDLRAVLLPYAALHDAQLRREARELALAWASDRNRIAASTVAAVLQTAARHADAATYATFERELAGATRNDRGEIIKALAITRDPALRERAFASSLASPGAGEAPVLDGREAFMLLEAAFEDVHNAPAALAFVRTQWEPLMAKLPAGSTARLLRRMNGLCTRAARADYVEFFRDKAPQHEGARKAFDQSLESIDICVAVNAAAK